MANRKIRRWEYEALDHDGQLHSDIVQARDHREVIKVCVSKGLFPQNIRELSEQAAANYGQIPRLKALKQKIENPPRPRSEFASMAFNIEEEEPELPRPKVRIDWTYVVFILLMLGLISLAAIL